MLAFERCPVAMMLFDPAEGIPSEVEDAGLTTFANATEVKP
jgi:hypothetical protein